MLEIKIICNCGAKYKFDVEPLNGRMPGPVQCPVCRVDGTHEGNRLIGEALTRGVAPAVSAVIVPPVVPIAASGTISRVAPVPAGSPAIAIPNISIPKPAISVRVGAPATAQPQQVAAAAAAPVAHPVLPSAAPQKLEPPKPPAGPLVPKPDPSGVVRLGISAQAAEAQPTPMAQSSHPPVPVVSSPAAPARSKSKSSGKPNGVNVTRGYIGAVVGGLIGMAIWYGIIVITNYELGLIAWGVGGLTGFLAVVFAGGTEKSIGVAAALCAIVAILGGEILATKHVSEKMIASLVGKDYDGRVAHAKEAVQAKSDDEIKTFLAKTESEEGLKVEASSIDAARISEFKKKELPEYKKLAEGKMSRKEYEQDKLDEVKALIPFGLVLKESIGVFTILWIFFGVGTAYRLGSGSS
jgi:hypothetical protein